MHWQTFELILRVFFSVSFFLGALRSPHPAISKAENDGSFFLAAIFAAFHWAGVLAILASLWFASPHLRDWIWLAVVFLWISSHAWFRRQSIRRGCNV
jgi:hypothetical protein